MLFFLILLLLNSFIAYNLGYSISFFRSRGTLTEYVRCPACDRQARKGVYR